MVLVVDANEKISRAQRADALAGRLRAYGPVHVRRLPVGDFLWVALPRSGGGGAAVAAAGGAAATAAAAAGCGGEEDGGEVAWLDSECLVLDSVVERKQIADFLGTICSHRHYHSQKVRLGRCGLARPYYLVEGRLEGWPHVGERERMRLELARIGAADGLVVHESANTEATLAFLGAATQRLRQMLGGASEAELRSRGALCSWSEFCAATSPPETIGQAFGRMLLNVHGMSAPKVDRLLAAYPTPRCLVEALEAHRDACAARGAPPTEAGWLLAELLEPGRRLRKLSEAVTAVFVGE